MHEAGNNLAQCAVAALTDDDVVIFRMLLDYLRGVADRICEKYGRQIVGCRKSLKNGGKASAKASSPGDWVYEQQHFFHINAPFTLAAAYARKNSVEDGCVPHVDITQRLREIKLGAFALYAF